MVQTVNKIQRYKSSTWPNMTAIYHMKSGGADLKRKGFHWLCLFDPPTLVYSVFIVMCEVRQG